MKEERFTPHKPDQYVCGIYIYQTDAWVGEFWATTEELIGYGIEADLEGPELQIVSDMIETQGVYEQWYNSVTKKYGKKSKKS